MSETGQLGVSEGDTSPAVIDPGDHEALAHFFIGLCVYDTPPGEEDRDLNSSLKGLRSRIRLHSNLGYPVPVEDLTQAAMEGVIKAAEDFDADKGFAFSTHAGWVIPRLVIRTMTSADSSELPLRYPSNVLGDMIAGKYERPKFTSVDTVAGQLSVEVLERGTHWDSPVEEEALRRIEEDTVWDILMFSGVLQEKERNIIALRFGFATGEPMTLQQIGDIFGVTRETIRKTEAKALSRLRHSKIVNELLLND